MKEYFNFSSVHLRDFREARAANDTEKGKINKICLQKQSLLSSFINNMQGQNELYSRETNRFK